MMGQIYRDVIPEQHVRLFRVPEFVSMDYNARPHGANIVNQCLQSEDITHSDWSAFSPDLNPVEHAWDILGRTAFTKAVNHLQEVIENDPVDKNAVETAFEMLDAKSVKLKKIDEDILELMIETSCTQEAYNIEYEAIEGYTEKMIAWQVRVKNIMKTDDLGQKDNHRLVTSSSSSLRLPKIQLQQFSGELTDWLRFHNQFKRIHEDESIDDGDKF
ncbi:transposable element Tcb1 transposase [Trichonephila clavipes]|nr:transposable element Tcb1 transposase [Trichonephila clavipes]